MRELRVEDALLYLDDVKHEFRDRPAIYNEFLAIMKNFKTQEVDTPGVIERVSRLFRGYNNLILGFNTFLPEGYKIRLEDLVRQDEARAREAAAAAAAANQQPAARPMHASPFPQQQQPSPTPWQSAEAPKPAPKPPVAAAAKPQAAARKSVVRSPPQHQPAT